MDLETKTTIDESIRRVPNFPKPGILFYDITGLLVNPKAFDLAVAELVEDVRKSGADTITAIEARGFIFAAPVALALGLPLVLIRKKGKLPNEVLSTEFNLEYGTDTLCIQRLDLETKRRFYLIDDLIATGGTLAAACKLIESEGSLVSGIGAVIGLPFLGFHVALGGKHIKTIIDYHGE